jgi:hypothetical protein
MPWAALPYDTPTRKFLEREGRLKGAASTDWFAVPSAMPIGDCAAIEWWTGGAWAAVDPDRLRHFPEVVEVGLGHVGVVCDSYEQLQTLFPGMSPRPGRRV